MQDYNTNFKGELYDLTNDPHEWYNQFNNLEFSSIRFAMISQMLTHIATAFAKEPAFGD